MNNKTAAFVSSVAVIVACAAGFLYHEHRSLDATRAEFQLEELQPMATLLKENQALRQELQSDRFTEKDSDVLESFLAKIRSDGVAKHADMKQRLDTLAENNTSIVALVKAYAPHAKTSAFTTESDKFRNYASAWRDRWNSVMEIFMAGGNYATASVPFPPRFLATVDAEVVAAR